MRLLLLAIILLAATLSAERGVFKTTVCLEWDPPSDPADLEGTAYKIYGSHDITEPMVLWPVITSVVGQTWAEFETELVATFFAVTATNWRGESAFSNVLRVSGPPSDVRGLKIKIQPK